MVVWFLLLFLFLVWSEEAILVVVVVDAFAILSSSLLACPESPPPPPPRGLFFVVTLIAMVGRKLGPVRSTGDLPDVWYLFEIYRYDLTTKAFPCCCSITCFPLVKKVFVETSSGTISFNCDIVADYEYRCCSTRFRRHSSYPHTLRLAARITVDRRSWPLRRFCGLFDLTGWQRRWWSDTMIEERNPGCVVVEEGFWFFFDSRMLSLDIVN